MKLFKYLNENNIIDLYSLDDEEIIKLVQKDCKEFLEDLGGSKEKWLYRGSRSLGGRISLINTRKDRKPKDSPTYMHKVLNNLFKSSFGINLRSESVFCMAKNHVGEYGASYIVIPVGKYELFWSYDIKDLYEYFYINQQNIDLFLKEKNYDSLAIINDMAETGNIKELKKMIIKNIIKNEFDHFIVNDKMYYNHYDEVLPLVSNNPSIKNNQYDLYIADMIMYRYGMNKKNIAISDIVDDIFDKIESISISEAFNHFSKNHYNKGKIYDIDFNDMEENEIMMKCDKYYAFPLYSDKILKHLK